MEAVKESITFRMSKFMQGKTELYTNDNKKIAGLSPTKTGYSVRMAKDD
jgi:hypothetical protein